MTDHQNEQEIQDRGYEPVARVTPDMITAAIVGADYNVLPGTQITVCTITLRNGTKVLGYNYGAIDPACQDWAQGRQAAYDMAREKIWELEGYALRSYLHAMKGPRTSYSTESLLEAIDAKAGKVELIPIQAIGLQPIDTAPTDGTVFLGYRERDGRWGECYRVQRDDCEMWSFGGTCAAEEVYHGFRPTLWMPLPAKSPA